MSSLSLNHLSLSVYNQQKVEKIYKAIMLDFIEKNTGVSVDPVTGAVNASCLSQYKNIDISKIILPNEVELMKMSYKQSKKDYIQRMEIINKISKPISALMYAKEMQILKSLTSHNIT